MAACRELLGVVTGQLSTQIAKLKGPAAADIEPEQASGKSSKSSKHVPKTDVTKPRSHDKASDLDAQPLDLGISNKQKLKDKSKDGILVNPSPHEDEPTRVTAKKRLHQQDSFETSPAESLKPSTQASLQSPHELQSASKPKKSKANATTLATVHSSDSVVDASIDTTLQKSPQTRRTKKPESSSRVDAPPETPVVIYPTKDVPRPQVVVSVSVENSPSVQRSKGKASPKVSSTNKASVTPAAQTEDVSTVSRPESPALSQASSDKGQAPVSKKQKRGSAPAAQDPQTSPLLTSKKPPASIVDKPMPVFTLEAAAALAAPKSRLSDPDLTPPPIATRQASTESGAFVSAMPSPPSHIDHISVAQASATPVVDLRAAPAKDAPLVIPSTALPPKGLPAAPSASHAASSPVVVQQTPQQPLQNVGSSQVIVPSAGTLAMSAGRKAPPGFEHPQVPVFAPTVTAPRPSVPPRVTQPFSSDAHVLPSVSQIAAPSQDVRVPAPTFPIYTPSLPRQSTPPYPSHNIPHHRSADVNRAAHQPPFPTVLEALCFSLDSISINVLALALQRCPFLLTVLSGNDFHSISISQLVTTCVPSAFQSSEYKFATFIHIHASLIFLEFQASTR
jgi:hypothetical protein